MRVPETPSSSPNTSRPARTETRKPEKSKSFSKILQRSGPSGETPEQAQDRSPAGKKAEGHPASRRQPPSGGSEDEKRPLSETVEKTSEEAVSTKGKFQLVSEPPPVPQPLAGPWPSSPPQVQETEGPRGAQPARVIDSLVQEIVAGVNAAGAEEVQIQLQSSTLEGLRIHISKEEGNLSVQFFSRSEEVSGLLSRNLESLASGLAARGLAVGALQVQTSPAPLRREESGRSQDRRGRQGGQGRQRRGGGRG